MEKTIKLFTALAAFQQEVPAIHEGTKGYGYTYSDLKTIFKVINPYMKKNGLGFTQLLQGTTIKTIIFHTESGESIESTTEIPQNITLKGMNTFQVNGSGITYYRRYSLSSALGLVTDVDSDATGEETKAPVKKWITEAQFIKAKEFTAEQLETVFASFKFRKEEQQEELQEIYNNLKSITK
jgi:hypothetical protein